MDTRKKLVTTTLLACLILAFANAIPNFIPKLVHASTVFSDGFESGDFTAWTSTDNVGASFGVVNTVKYAGTYSAEGTFLNTTGNYVFAQKTLGSSYSTLYISASVRFTAHIADTTDLYALVQLRCSDGSTFSVVLHRGTGASSYLWQARIPSGSNYDSAPFTLIPNAWYNLTLGGTVSTTVGTVDIWVNGTKVVTQSGLNTGTYLMNAVRVEAWLNNGNADEGTMEWDAVTVETTYSSATTPPYFLSFSANSTLAGNGTQLSIVVKLDSYPDDNVSYACREWNITGYSVNSTFVALNHVLQQTVLFNETLANTTGKVVAIRFFANTTGAYENVSGYYYITLTTTIMNDDMSLYAGDDGFLYFKNDTQMQLRGVNKGGYADTCVGDWTPIGTIFGTGNHAWSDATVNAHMDQMQQWGINVMRICTLAQFFLNDESVMIWDTVNPTSKNFKWVLNQTVYLAKQHSMYVVITFYGIYYDQSKLPNNPVQYITTPTDAKNITTNAPFTANDFYNLWGNMTTFIGNYTNVVFELFNEPTYGTTVTTFAQWQAIAQSATSRIRQTEQAAGYDSHLILMHFGYSYPGLNETWATSLIGSENIAYGIDVYDGGFTWTPWLYTDISSSWWTYESVKLRLQEYGLLNMIQNLHKPVFCMEVGAETGVAAEQMFFENALAVLGQWGASYATFIFDVPISMYSLQYYQVSGAYTVAPFPPNDMGTLLIEALSTSSSAVVITISTPTNTTYSTSTIVLTFSASGGTILVRWFNIFILDTSTWVYALNQTYVSTMNLPGLADDSYRLYCWANNTYGTIGAANVNFTITTAISYAGIRIYAATAIIIRGVAFKNFSAAVRFEAVASQVMVTGNTMQNCTTKIYFGAIVHGTIKDNFGYNPVGIIITPVSGVYLVDSGSGTIESGTTYTVAESGKVIYISGTVSAIEVDGVTVFAGAVAVAIPLVDGQTFKISWSSTPTITVIAN